MKIDREEAVSFLVDLGFPKAPEWDDARIIQKLEQVPAKVTEEDVEPEHKGIYNKLGEAVANQEEISLTGGDEAEEEPAAKPSKKKPAAKKKAAKPAAKEKPAKPAAKKKAAKAKAEKPAPKKKAAKPAAKEPAAKKKRAAREREPKKEIPVDKYGAREGSLLNAVHAGLSEKEWKDSKELAEEIGSPFKRVRNRLYRAVKKGNVECKKLVLYRLVPAK